MKESVDRIRRVGHSTILSDLARKTENEDNAVAGAEMVAEKEGVKNLCVIEKRAQWKHMSNSVCEIVIATKSCNEEDWRVLDLSAFTSLRVFEVGDQCFKGVCVFELIGLRQLEKVLIGKHCFLAYAGCKKSRSDRHFCVKNCEKLRELTIGCGSFMYYLVCDIENDNSLEVIEIGEHCMSSCFMHGSLLLKSKNEKERVMNRLTQIEDAPLWRAGISSFSSCSVRECIIEEGNDD